MFPKYIYQLIIDRIDYAFFRAQLKLRKTKAKKLEFAVSSLERNIKEQEAKTGYLAIRKMRPSKAECLWTVLVLLKTNRTILPNSLSFCSRDQCVKNRSLVHLERLYSVQKVHVQY